MADRIALLDDQWALVRADQAALADYLALVGRMGGAVDARAWQQVAGALASVELDEFGKAGHDAFAAYARSVVKPVADRLGSTAQSGETPAIQQLRRRVLGSLGLWGYPQVVNESKERFAKFLTDRHSISPDDQEFILTTVAAHADAATFEQLHSIAKSAQEPSEKRRLYRALASVRDTALSAEVGELVMSPEIAPQEDILRIRTLFRLADTHPQLGWNVYMKNSEKLFASLGAESVAIQAQYVPQMFWGALPPAELESWLRKKIPSEFSGKLEHSMERARLRLAQRERLVPAADDYVRRPN